MLDLTKCSNQFALSTSASVVKKKIEANSFAIIASIKKKEGYKGKTKLDIDFKCK